MRVWKKIVTSVAQEFGKSRHMSDSRMVFQTPLSEYTQMNDHLAAPQEDFSLFKIPETTSLHFTNKQLQHAASIIIRVQKNFLSPKY